MAEIIELEDQIEKVILVGVSEQDGDDAEDSVAELAELVRTAGAVVVGTLIQKRELMHPGTYVGTGKVAEIAAMIAERGATGIVCDDELSPAQLKNLEQMLDTKVMDRTLIILDIFAARATTSEGKIQVELAQLKYRLSRLTGRGIPVSCEVDIYGCLSEFIGTCVSADTVTLLDINNTVPDDMYEESIKGKFNYTHNDTFMGFHCGNTNSKKLTSCNMKYQMIMARTLPEEVTQGTLEGDIVPGDITFYRLQSTADNKLRAYIAQGEVLPVATRSFGGIGIFAIPEMGRFYRHVLIEKNFPHHGAVAFGHFGKALYEVFKYIGVPVEDLNFNQPKGMLYPTENPFA